MYNQSKLSYPGTENRFGYGVMKTSTKPDPTADTYSGIKSYIGYNPIGGSSNVSSNMTEGILLPETNAFRL